MKATKLILAFAAAALLLAGCKEDNSGEEAGKVTGVKLDKTELTLAIGDSETLKATVTPDDAVNKKVTWSSDDEAVAKVSKSGKVTAVADGEATITVTTDDGGHTATCEVTVAKPVAVTGVELNKSELTLTIGASETLTATVTPDYAVNKKVTWSSDDETVATVDAGTGEVTAVADGEAVITVTTDDGGFEATCAVTVERIKVTGVELDQTMLTLRIAQSATLTATVSPGDATNKKVTWSSDDEAVAMVNSKTGEVIALVEGEAVITVTTEDGGYTAECTVTVTPITDILPYITDPNFKAYVQYYMDTDHGSYSWDTDGNGELSSAEAAAVTNINIVYGYPDDNHQIASLDGIEFFTGLEKLHCSKNQLTTIDISRNTKLAYLYCEQNQLTELNISTNTELLILYCPYNQLTELNISNNTKLASLYCYNNQLTELNTSNNAELLYLHCDQNQLTELNISTCTRLLDLYCQYNQLTELNISDNTKLTSLYCHSNQLTELNTSNNAELLRLHCEQNQLTELNLSNNTALQYLQCYNNRLASLDASDMAFWDDGISYSLYCGRQTTDGETPRTLTLTLREDKKPYWESDLKDDSDNSNVVLAE